MSTVQTPQQSPLTRLAAARPGYQHLDGRALIERLNFIRSSRLMIGTASGLLWSSLAFLAIVLFWMWTDVVLDLSPRLRVIGWLMAFGLSAFLMLRSYRRWRIAAASKAVAATLDQLTASGGQIQAGLDLAEDLHLGRVQTKAPLTRGLADLAVRQAALLARQPSHMDAASPKPLIQSGAVLFASCFVALVLVVAMPRMAWTELKRFFDPWGGHAAWSQYEFQVTPGISTVAYGDSLEIKATVTGPPFEQLEMVIVPSAAQRMKNNETLDVEDVTPIDVLPMFPESSGSWHASLADIKEPFDFFLRVHRARSEAWPVTVLTVPSITDVQVEIIAPLYTELAPFRGTLPANGLEGLPGTSVKLTAQSNRPLSGGTMRIQLNDTAQTVAMIAEPDPHRVTGAFDITQPGRLDITVIDEAEQPSAAPYSAPIRVLEDQSPMVRLVQPQAVSFATPSAVVPIAVAAEDDYGLRRCQLFRSLNNSRPLPVDLKLPARAPRRVQLQTQLPLADYDLQPGDEIKLFARVEDNDPAGPAAPVGKGSESTIVSIRIISDEDFDRAQQQKAGMEMLSNRHQQAQRRMESLTEQMQKLKEKLDAAEPDSSVAEEAREEMEQLAAEMQKAADALKAMAEKPLPFDLDKELAPQLAEMAEMLKKMGEQTAKMSGNPDLKSKQASDEMQKQIEAMQERQKQHQEEAMKPLQHLAQVLPLKQDEAAFVQLTQRQRALADRLKSLKDQDADADPATRARMRELEEEQHQLREQLTDLLQRIDEDIARLPDDPELDELRNSAQEFVSAVRDSAADTMMADAESFLTEFEGHNGWSNADEAAKTLEQFLSQCKGMGGACSNSCLKFSPGLGSSMSSTLDQLSPGMGMKSGGVGMGMGGSGGESAQSSTMENVGMYGTTPLMDASQSSLGSSDDTAPTGVMTEIRGDGSDKSDSGFSASQTNSAFGNAETGVPSQYRRQAGRYMQKLAEELEP